MQGHFAGISSAAWIDQNRHIDELVGTGSKRLDINPGLYEQGYEAKHVTMMRNGGGSEGSYVITASLLNTK